MDELLISMALSVLFETLKKLSEPKRSIVKRAMLKLRNAINIAYASDPDFR